MRKTINVYVPLDFFGVCTGGRTQKKFFRWSDHFNSIEMGRDVSFLRWLHPIGARQYESSSLNMTEYSKRSSRPTSVWRGEATYWRLHFGSVAIDICKYATGKVRMNVNDIWLLEEPATNDTSPYNSPLNKQEVKVITWLAGSMITLSSFCNVSTVSACYRWWSCRGARFALPQTKWIFTRSLRTSHSSCWCRGRY